MKSRTTASSANNKNSLTLETIHTVAASDAEDTLTANAIKALRMSDLTTWPTTTANHARSLARITPQSPQPSSTNSTTTSSPPPSTTMPTKQLTHSANFRPQIVRVLFPLVLKLSASRVLPAVSECLPPRWRFLGRRCSASKL